MDLELFPLMVGMGVGALFGTKGKGVMKSMAKGYFAFLDRTREWTASAREDMRDAIEEARYERSNETSHQEKEEQTPQVSRSSASHAKGTSRTTRKRAASTGSRGRASSTGSHARSTKIADSGEPEELPKAA